MMDAKIVNRNPIIRSIRIKIESVIEIYYAE